MDNVVVLRKDQLYNAINGWEEAMKVSQLIEWLETQDQDATVEVVVREPATGWGGDSVSAVEFTPELSNYVDFRGNPFVKDDSALKDRRILLLGED